MTSASSRLLSGTLSSWLRISLTITTQLAVTPIFLSHWSIEKYGFWLLFQAITPLVQLVDNAHQTYLGYECLRLGGRRKKKLSITISSALACCFATGTLTVVLVAAIVQFAERGFLGTSVEVIVSQGKIGALLIAHTIVWVITGCVGGMITRMLSCFGYFARFSWWTLVMQLVNTLTPLVAVVCGYDFVIAVLAMLLSTLCVNLLLIRDALMLCRRHGIMLNVPSRRVGWRNFRKSIMLSLSSVSDLLRQQGVRLILAPLGGAQEVAAFAVTRTGANFALQGLATITQPLMPELMGFVRDRDQVRAESAFALVWLILLVIINPGVLFVQWLGPSIFTVWTHGKVPFDAILFALLVADVLIFALAQPAIAIVQGNNLTKVQFSISMLAGVLTVIGIFAGMHFAGIRGAAAVLAIVEIVVASIYVYVANNWMTGGHMRWPWRSFLIVQLSVIVTIITLLWIAVDGKSWLLIISAVALQYVAVCVYCMMLPEEGKRWLARLINAPAKKMRQNLSRWSPFV